MEVFTRSLSSSATVEKNCTGISSTGNATVSPLPPLPAHHDPCAIAFENWRAAKETWERLNTIRAQSLSAKVSQHDPSISALVHLNPYEVYHGDGTCYMRPPHWEKHELPVPAAPTAKLDGVPDTDVMIVPSDIRTSVLDALLLRSAIALGATYTLIRNGHPYRVRLGWRIL